MNNAIALINKFKQSLATQNTIAFHMITDQEITFTQQHPLEPELLKYILSTFVYIELLPALNGTNQALLAKKLQKLQTFFLLTSLNINVDISCNQIVSKTLLQIAISKNSDILFEYLLDYLGVDINACNSEGVYPIETAIEKENNNYVEKLVERGAKVDFVSSSLDYKSSLCLLLCQDHPFTADNLFLAFFLILNGANVNPPSSSNVDQPLHLALGKGNFEMIQLLISRGADIHAVSINGDSSLMLAIKTNHTPDQKKIISFLIDHDADFCHINNKGNLLHSFNMLYDFSFEDIDRLIVNAVQKGVDINHRNTTKGKTPLHCAAANGNINLMKALIKNDAQINIQDNKNNNPLDLLFSAPQMTVAMIQKDFFENQRAELFNQIKEELFPVFLPTFIQRGLSEEAAYHHYNIQMTESEMVQFLLNLNFKNEDIAEYSQFILFFEKYRIDPIITSQCWSFVQNKPEAAFSVKFKKLISIVTGLSDDEVSQKLFDIYVKEEGLSLEPFAADNNKTRFSKLLDIACEFENVDLATNLFEKHLKHLSQKEIENLKLRIVENPGNDFQHQLNQLIERVFVFEKSEAYRNSLKIADTLTKLFTTNREQKAFVSKLALILSKSENKQNSIKTFFENPRIKNRINASDTNIMPSSGNNNNRNSPQHK